MRLVSGSLTTPQSCVTFSEPSAETHAKLINRLGPLYAGRPFWNFFRYSKIVSAKKLPFGVKETLQFFQNFRLMSK